MSVLRSVLVVSHRFPPHGGGGVQRTTYFVRHLSDFGWSPHVLTGPLGRRKLLDEGLLDMIPAHVRVTRTGQLDVKRVYQVADRLRLGSLLRAVTPAFPHMEAGWIRQASAVGESLIGGSSFDLIYSSAYPVASHVVARRLKRKTGLPWVADCRDEWSLRPVLRWPTRFHRRLARHIDARLMEDADRVVTTSPAHTSNLARAFGRGEDDPRFITITNGFDAADFADPVQRSEDLSDRFVITHVGSVFRWRGAQAILEAVDRLTSAGLTPRLLIRFVGRTSEMGFEHLEANGHMQRLGYVSHPEAVRCMRTSDALLLINTEETNIPGKTWEYLAAGRPILAAVREGPTADVIRGHEAGMVVHPDDSMVIEEALRGLYLDWAAGRLHDTGRPELVAERERRALTGRLAGVFDQAIDGEDDE